jgi:hypothetical protein
MALALRGRNTDCDDCELAAMPCRFRIYGGSARVTKYILNQQVERHAARASNPTAFALLSYQL